MSFEVCREGIAARPRLSCIRIFWLKKWMGFSLHFFKRTLKTSCGSLGEAKSFVIRIAKVLFDTA